MTANRNYQTREKQMNVFTMLGNLIIGPLKLLFELVFSLANELDNPGLSIVCLSLVMNFLVLPLYRRADAMQEEERMTEAKLKHWVSHIRRTFHGDERFMILQTYYRQNNYTPANALRGALPLLLEIPFFIAAYQFLSGLYLLRYTSFGPIRDLGAPDALLQIGGVTVNVLPILMTVINLISSEIYAKGAPLKTKIQLYAMALIFLVFLYSSPAGLTFYWTLNNLFSLLKNIFYKLKNAKLILFSGSALTGCSLLVFAIIRDMSLKLRLLASVLGIVLIVPLLVLRWSSKKGMSRGDMLVDRHEMNMNPDMFFLCAAYLTILTGLMIPSSVLTASPTEFIETKIPLNPLWYMVGSLLLAAGCFLVWGGVFYKLASDRVKQIMEAGVWILCCISTVNYLCFGTTFGTLSSLLAYEIKPSFPWATQLLNLALCCSLAFVAVLLIRKWPRMIQVLCLAGLLSICIMSVKNTWTSGQSIREAKIILSQEESGEVPIPISKKGKNVVVLMLDRAIGSFVPSMFYEKPELLEQYDGFIYYPNTISHGAHTNFGASGLFGGYEYTPEEMNKRSTESLRDKYNEAITILPKLFSDEGYTVTISDLPYVGNYSVQPDYSIFQQFPGTNAFSRENFTDIEEVERHHSIRLRNFFCYSVFRCSPVFLQGMFYDHGNYHSPNPFIQYADSRSIATGYSEDFVENFRVLENLNLLTEILDEEKNTLLLMVSDITHAPTILKEPEYVPDEKVNNTEYDTAHEDRFNVGTIPLVIEDEDQMRHYHANMAALLQLGKWFDYLRQNNIYDNTRIILVSDHGSYVQLSKDMMLSNEVNALNYNPLLMVKDFDSHGELKTDGAFMTNADVPTIALADLIMNPINPYSGKPITSEEKESHPQRITTSHEHDVSKNNGNTYKPGLWFSVEKDLFDLDNWTELGIF